MQYSRANPSSRYLELTRLYRQLHVEGERRLGIPPERTFCGSSLLPQAPQIKRLIERTGATNLLDYGAGKGQLYDVRDVVIHGEGTWPSIKDYWAVESVHCYDPSYEPFSRLPEGSFDGVICTDVLEHCPEEDVPWIVDELFAYAECFVYANVACYPANKQLPNGENAHCTVKPPQWWQPLWLATATRHPGIAFQCWLTLPGAEPGTSTKLCLRSGC